MNNATEIVSPADATASVITARLSHPRLRRTSSAWVGRLVGIALATQSQFPVALAQTSQPSTSATASASATRPTSDVLINFRASDGTPLDALLTLPTPGGPGAARGPFPVVFYLHGAGPRTYNTSFRYMDADGKVQVATYMDFHATELAKRGIAFFRMSKRGCKVTTEPPYMSIDRPVFSSATVSVLLDDYAAALKVLRERNDIDPTRVALLGGSEGTFTGPLLARRSPRGIVAVAMMGYAADNAAKTVEWQNTIGPWRNLAYMIPGARDGDLTKAELDEATKDHAALVRAFPFATLDADADGRVTAAELEQLNRPRYEALLKAVRERDDDFLWKNLLNLNSAYLQEWWERPPNHENLLALDIPLAIFHGTLDAACRVEGVRETEEEFRRAGRTNLFVKIYENSNHDLDWSWKTMDAGGPPTYRDAFDWIAAKLK